MKRCVAQMDVCCSATVVQGQMPLHMGAEALHACVWWCVCVTVRRGLRPMRGHQWARSYWLSRDVPRPSWPSASHVEWNT